MALLRRRSQGFEGGRPVTLRLRSLNATLALQETAASVEQLRRDSEAVRTRAQYDALVEALTVASRVPASTLVASLIASGRERTRRQTRYLRQLRQLLAAYAASPLGVERLEEAGFASQARQGGLRGFAVAVGGRVDGAERKKTEWRQGGQLPRHTRSSARHYALVPVETAYGVLSVKVWLCYV